MKEIIYHPIGNIHSPYKNVAEIPVLPKSFQGVKGIVEILPKYQDGLQDLAGFSHVILLVHFHQSDKMKLTFSSLWDGNEHGIFASRAATRPNPICRES